MEMVSLMEVLIKAANLCDKELVNEVSRQFKADIDGFKELMETLVVLRDPALDVKQWEEIKLFLLEKKIKDPFHDVKNHIYNLQYIKDNNLMEFKDSFMVPNMLCIIHNKILLKGNRSASHQGEGAEQDAH